MIPRTLQVRSGSAHQQLSSAAHFVTLLSTIATLFGLSSALASAQDASAVRRFVHLAISSDARRVAWIGPPSRTHSVAANAVVLADVNPSGLMNIVPLPGENGISEWMVPFFGATAYEDKAIYAQSSPINFIANARTPTLIVVGERDAECPAPQSFEFWRGLQHVGVKTQLVVYPDEGHAFQNPAHQRDLLQRTVRWFDAYLKQ